MRVSVTIFVMSEAAGKLILSEFISKGFSVSPAFSNETYFTNEKFNTGMAFWVEKLKSCKDLKSLQITIAEAIASSKINHYGYCISHENACPSNVVASNIELDKPQGSPYREQGV